MSQKTITIYHNPKCSKSRETLKIVSEYCQQHPEIQIEEIRYLENPPSSEILKEVCQLLNVPVQEIIRTGEKLFKELGYTKADLNHYEEEHWLNVLQKHSKLIERPIVQL